MNSHPGRVFQVCFGHMKFLSKGGIVEQHFDKNLSHLTKTTPQNHKIMELFILEKPSKLIEPNHFLIQGQGQQ